MKFLALSLAALVGLSPAAGFAASQSVNAFDKGWLA
jgi:hypothetical protein